MAEMKQPDAKKHQNISFAKSIVRMIGYACLVLAVPTTLMQVAVIVLIASEIIGVMEELV